MVKVDDRYRITLGLDEAPMGEKLTVVVTFDREVLLKRTLAADSSGRLGAFTFREDASPGRHRLVVKAGRHGEGRQNRTFGLLDWTEPPAGTPAATEPQPGGPTGPSRSVTVADIDAREEAEQARGLPAAPPPWAPPRPVGRGAERRSPGPPPPE